MFNEFGLLLHCDRFHFRILSPVPSPSCGMASVCTWGLLVQFPLCVAMTESGLWFLHSPLEHESGTYCLYPLTLPGSPTAGCGDDFFPMMMLSLD